MGKDILVIGLRKKYQERAAWPGFRGNYVIAGDTSAGRRVGIIAVFLLLRLGLVLSPPAWRMMWDSALISMLLKLWASLLVRCCCHGDCY